MPAAARKKTRRRTNRVPAAYLRAVVEIGTARGFPPTQLLAGSGLDLPSLERPGVTIPGRVAVTVVQNIIALTGLDGIGFEMGLRINFTSHGYIGYATMSCSTLLDALKLLSKYFAVGTDDFRLRFHQENESMVLVFVETHQLGPLRQTATEALMTLIYRTACFVIGERIEGCEMGFEWPEPAYAAAYRDRLPTLSFRQRGSTLRIPVRYFDRRLQLSDPAASRQTLEQLQLEEARAGPKGLDVVPRVRAALAPATNGYPDVNSIAAKLSMSSRTLTRKLRESGTSFQKLLDEARHKEAMQLMKNPELDLQTISSILGYAEPICFTRAFRRWTGSTPSDFRNRWINKKGGFKVGYSTTRQEQKP